VGGDPPAFEFPLRCSSEGVLDKVLGVVLGVELDKAPGVARDVALEWAPLSPAPPSLFVSR